MHAELMNVDLGVAALRALAAVLIVSVVWPRLLEPRRWIRRRAERTATRRVSQ